jgi:hypothetical protein
MAEQRFPHAVTPVAPTGTETVNAFWDGVDAQGNDVGGFGPVERPVYPESPLGEALRKERVRRSLGLGEFARAVGLTPVQLSALEHGKAKTTPEGWAALGRALATLKEVSNG